LYNLEETEVTLFLAEKSYNPPNYENQVLEIKFSSKVYAEHLFIAIYGTRFASTNFKLSKKFPFKVLGSTGMVIHLLEKLHAVSYPVLDDETMLVKINYYTPENLDDNSFLKRTNFCTIVTKTKEAENLDFIFSKRMKKDDTDPFSSPVEIGIKKNGIHCLKYLYEILKKLPQKSKKKVHIPTV